MERTLADFNSYSVGMEAILVNLVLGSGMVEDV